MTKNPFDIPVTVKTMESNEKKTLVEPLVESTTEEEKEVVEKKKTKSDEDDLSIKGIHLPLSPTLHQKFKIFCTKENITMKEFLLKAIKKAVEKEDKKNK